MQYRREIDGLRAFAVLPVILFHAGVSAFSGGFVGVDVFFVISGYLITTIIVSEQREGRFSIIRFYERRARRILPALFLVMALSLPAAWLWLLPSDAKDFSASLVAVSLFASNLLFWLQSGYFDAAAELKPLLHTWSLAVEEQYYVLFPLFVLFAARWGRRGLAFALAAVALLSLCLAQWGAGQDPSANFYLLPSRAWELLLGALAALYLMDRPPESLAGPLANLGSLLGLGLLLVAVFGFDSRTPFPGLYALVPTVGTVLIVVLAGPRTIVGRLLGHRWLVGVGLVSYSAYLWHQPLFVFAKHRSIDHPGTEVFLVLAVLSMLLAYASWRWVEAPFRDRARIGRADVFRFAAAGSAFFIAVGLAGHFSGGGASLNQQRQRLHSIENRLRVNYGLDASCRSDFTLSAKCRTGSSPEVVVWGDSYAMHLVPALLAARPDLGLVQMTKSVCGPLLGIAPVNEKYTAAWAAGCIRQNDQVVDWLRQTPSVKVVVMSSPFGQYVNDGARVLLRDGRVVEGRGHAAAALAETLGMLRVLGVRPILVSPPPVDGTDIGRCLVKATQLGVALARCDFSRAVARARQQNVIALLQSAQPSSRVIWLADRICDEALCHASIGDVLVYRDDGHLSLEGSTFLGRAMNFAAILAEER